MSISDVGYRRYWGWCRCPPMHIGQLNSIVWGATKKAMRDSVVRWARKCFGCILGSVLSDYSRLESENLTLCTLLQLSFVSLQRGFIPNHKNLSSSWQLSSPQYNDNISFFIYLEQISGFNLCYCTYNGGLVDTSRSISCSRLCQIQE